MNHADANAASTARARQWMPVVIVLAMGVAGGGWVFYHPFINFPDAHWDYEGAGAGDGGGPWLSGGGG